MFDGAESPCTQTFGLGMFGAVAAAVMERLETFFTERGAPIFHEVSPMADASVMPILNERGYQPIELSSIMYRPLDASVPSPSSVSSGITTRVIDPHEVDLWARTSAAGTCTAGTMSHSNSLARFSASRRSFFFFER